MNEELNEEKIRQEIVDVPNISSISSLYVSNVIPATLINSSIVRKFPKIPATRTCNGKIHRQDRYCKKPAGWGTPHVRIGRCKLHGGYAGLYQQSGQLKYSNFVPADLVEKYEEFAVDPDMKCLNDEIALLRAKITIIESKNESGIYDKHVLMLTEEIRRLVETKFKIEEGIKSKIDLNVIMKIVDSIINIIETRVSDIELKKIIANDMRRLHLNNALMDNNN